MAGVGETRSLAMPEEAAAGTMMGNDYGGGVAERQARAIIITAKRALEAEAAGDVASPGKLSIKRSLERFLDNRKKSKTAATAATASSSSSY
ncbi:hypothetical protein GUJ93_ZPchr0006g43424 [Zizania palustris]|uniref:Uncharacterized protein n=1 Tax=Zizania palustris TaxID=103762 RepID=A0A8J5VWK7_ZIZPA|nr:hypothetical protein GUJ93_ZPchr0006g43424 [Zizania palustris]